MLHMRRLDRFRKVEGEAPEGGGRHGDVADYLPVSDNREPRFAVKRIDWKEEGGLMTLLRKLFGGRDAAPKTRVRICVECGMPIGEHRNWCSILRGQQEMAKASAARATGVTAAQKN
jgi:hypothetical protein